jgi:hypothetical protein
MAAATRIEQMRALFAVASNAMPLRVLLLTNEGLFRSLRPTRTSHGFYQSGAEADWVVVLWNPTTGDRAVSHELVHAFLEHSGPRRPLWLEEGMAEFYSTVEFKPAGWIVGKPIPSHAALLRQRPWLPAEEFFPVGHDSPMHDEASKTGVFYAQSWAVVHTLVTHPQFRDKVPSFLTALGEGVSLERACQEVLGMGPADLLNVVRRAIQSQRFTEASLTPLPVRETAGMAAPVDPASVMFPLAIALNKPALAKRWATTPLHQGLIALAEGDKPAARKWLAEAGADSTALFELAMLIREENAADPRVDAMLRTVIERNPQHAEAHFLRGLRFAARGDSEEAIDSFQQAARILPRQATFWHALAIQLEKSGRLAEAGHAALRCRMAARDASEREMAAGIARLIHEPAVVRPRSDKPPVHVPESWKGLRGDTVMQGELIEFDCGTQPPTAHIRTSSTVLRLRLLKPNEIRVGGIDGIQHEFACGPQKRKVQVEYTDATRELTAIEFR